jgi:hypothetical protein
VVAPDLYSVSAHWAGSVDVAHKFRQIALHTGAVERIMGLPVARNVVLRSVYTAELAALLRGFLLSLDPVLTRLAFYAAMPRLRWTANPCLTSQILRL